MLPGITLLAKTFSRSDSSEPSWRSPPQPCWLGMAGSESGGYFAAATSIVYNMCFFWIAFIFMASSSLSRISRSIDSLFCYSCFCFNSSSFCWVSTASGTTPHPASSAVIHLAGLQDVHSVQRTEINSVCRVEAKSIPADASQLLPEHLFHQSSLSY